MNVRDERVRGNGRRSAGIIAIGEPGRHYSITVRFGPLSQTSRMYPAPALSRRGTARSLAVALAAAAALFAPLGAAQAQIAQTEYAARRAALAQAMEQDGAFIVRGSAAPTRDYMPFFQTPAFTYLTGIDEPDAALLLVKRGGTVTQFAFVRPRDPAREIWEGVSLGTEGVAQLTGMRGRPRPSLDAVLDSVLAGGGTLYTSAPTDLPGFGGAEGGWTPPAGVTIVPLTGALQRLRAHKSPAELELIRKAVAITVEAHRDAMRLMEPGLNEFEVQAAIEYVFRRYGAERPAFASIVGSGPNATSLHYKTNDRFIEDGEVVVVDIGANYGGYSADVTRTLPANGRFSAEQRAIYQIVRDAQEAAVREARPGGSFGAMSQAAAQALGEGLARLGLIDSVGATYLCGDTRQCPQLSLFYMHGLGHGIGLEVHDPDRYQFGGVAVGSVFTIEPGIYIAGNVLDRIPNTAANSALRARLTPLVARYANIGVRIEDDYIVGENGAEWISQAPREIDEVEAAMAEPWTGPSGRRADMVEWYRRR